MRSNQTTLRIVGGIFAVCGIIATIVGAIIGFMAYVIPGIIILICGIFTTVANTCLYFGLANVQENQLLLAEMIKINQNGGKETTIDEIEKTLNNVL